MKPEVEGIQFRFGNLSLFFISIPTKNGKKRPQLKHLIKNGVINEDVATGKKNIPAQILREIYARAAVIFNKF